MRRKDDENMGNATRFEKQSGGYRAAFKDKITIEESVEERRTDKIMTQAKTKK